MKKIFCLFFMLLLCAAVAFHAYADVVLPPSVFEPERITMDDGSDETKTAVTTSQEAGHEKSPTAPDKPVAPTTRAAKTTMPDKTTETTVPEEITETTAPDETTETTAVFETTEKADTTAPTDAEKDQADPGRPGLKIAAFCCAAAVVSLAAVVTLVLIRRKRQNGGV